MFLKGRIFFPVGVQLQPQGHITKARHHRWDWGGSLEVLMISRWKLWTLHSKLQSHKLPLSWINASMKHSLQTHYTVGFTEAALIAVQYSSWPMHQYLINVLIWDYYFSWSFSWYCLFLVLKTTLIFLSICVN